MRKQLTAAALAGVVGVAGLGALALGGTVASAATPSATATAEPKSSQESEQESEYERESESPATPGAPSEEGFRAAAAERVLEALAGLVSDGTITQEQARAVADTLAAEAPERGDRGGPGHGGPGGPGGRLGVDLGAVVAEELGLTEDEVRTALREGSTLAELAEQEGVETSALVEALVAAAQARLDEKVAAGAITQERADEIAAGLTDRFTSLVEEGFPGGPGGRGPGAPPEAPESGTEPGTESTTPDTETSSTTA